MFGLATNKEVKKAFRVRDEEIKKLKEKVEDNSLKIATLEGAYSVLSEKSKSQSQAVSGNIKQSQETFETKLIRRIKNNKKSLVMAEIIKLMPSHSVIEMFDIVVLEKRLCSKASFYRYIDSLKSQKLETKQRLNLDF